MQKAGNDQAPSVAALDENREETQDNPVFNNRIAPNAPNKKKVYDSATYGGGKKI